MSPRRGLRPWLTILALVLGLLAPAGASAVLPDEVLDDPVLEGKTMFSPPQRTFNAVFSQSGRRIHLQLFSDAQASASPLAYTVKSNVRTWGCFVSSLV